MSMIETKEYPGVPRISWTKKINPIWWMQNDEGLDPKYMPEWPLWKRKLFWFFRNFMWNFFKYVVGVEDRKLEVTGPVPVFTPLWSDANETGFKWSIIRTGWVVLPFISYSGKHINTYIGWLPSGGRLGVKLNFMS